MRIENQTPDVLASLYEATIEFTRQLQNHYYKQYHGDVDDLASDIYMEFLEKKGIEKKSLLDRFDGENIEGRNEQRWYAYIRTAVMRALIDESRTHPWITSSFDAMLDDSGDSEQLDVCLRDEPSIDEYDYEDMKNSMESRIKCMSPQQFNHVKNKYLSVRTVLAPKCVAVMDVVMNPRVQVSTTAGMLPVYKVNREVVCAVYNGKYEEFNKMTGKPKHSLGVYLTPAGMQFISQYVRFSADESRKDFLKEVCK